MRKKQFPPLALGLLLLFCLSGPAVAYVLPASHILELVSRNIVEPAGLVVSQTRERLIPELPGDDSLEQEKETLLDGSQKDASSRKVIDSGDGKCAGLIAGEGGSASEKLWFSYPGQYRCEGKTGRGSSITVFSNQRLIRVLDGKIVAQEACFADYYRDILLFRERSALSQRLQAVGVDMDRSSLQRYRGKICYVVGSARDKQNPESSLWVDRDTFFPVRYVVKREKQVAEVLYSRWERVSRTWYPMEITIILDNVPRFQIHVENFRLEADFSDSLFDIDRLYTR
ncbi:MAG: hypothetical protein R6V54_08375 [Desulfobacteraceae bacterium]